MKRIDWFDVLINVSLIGAVVMFVAYVLGLAEMPEY